MMTTMFRVLLVIFSIGTMIMMMRKIRQAKVQIEDAIFWVVFAFILVALSIFPKLADKAAALSGVYSTANFLFLSMIFLLIVKVFLMTIHISQLETKQKELVQKMALDQRKQEKLIKELEARLWQSGEKGEEEQDETLHKLEK